MKIVVANWKMNLLRKDAAAFCEAFLKAYKPKGRVEVGIAPSFPLIRAVKNRVATSGAKVFAQNGHAEAKGAFTGEVSMPQIQDSGCDGVILGHSECRQYNGETEATLVPKIRAARENELLPLLCIGETLAQREANQTLEVLRQQLSILPEVGAGPLWLAYEPVWAIGTGKVATPEQVREVHAFIREEVVRLLGEAGKEVPILYGGSVTPDNFEELLTIPDVAGGLVGGASLVPEKFLKLVQQAQAS
ncbi:triose-phosphate isomerase [Holophaga foetida]|uniref:triose-phosphate isomerase n=1 Tax=Holophaga foetida TaxID=35839 RepID=UPI000247498B|nr:triose-phosphate isomerase [Holophaga foetida]